MGIPGPYIVISPLDHQRRFYLPCDSIPSSSYSEGELQKKKNRVSKSHGPHITAKKHVSHDPPAAPNGVESLKHTGELSQRRQRWTACFALSVDLDCPGWGPRSVGLRLKEQSREEISHPRTDFGVETGISEFSTATERTHQRLQWPIPFGESTCMFLQGRAPRKRRVNDSLLCTAWMHHLADISSFKRCSNSKPSIAITTEHTHRQSQ